MASCTQAVTQKEIGATTATISAQAIGDMRLGHHRSPLTKTLYARMKCSCPTIRLVVKLKQ